jgi:hypothetical protein
MCETVALAHSAAQQPNVVEWFLSVPVCYLTQVQDKV